MQNEHAIMDKFEETDIEVTSQTFLTHEDPIHAIEDLFMCHYFNMHIDTTSSLWQHHKCVIIIV